MGFPQLNLLALTSGHVVPIEDVPDPVFAGRMMGDGVHIASLTSSRNVSTGDPLLTLVATNTDAAVPVSAPVETGDVETARMGLSVIPKTKSVVRRLNLAQCKSVAQAVLQLTSAEAIRVYVRQVWPWLDAAKA